VDHEIFFVKESRLAPQAAKPIHELRDLMRYRRKLVETQAAERNRLL
jgi:hypothetical protein